MKLYTLKLPECEEIHHTLQTLERNVIILTEQEALATIQKQNHNQMLFILPLYYSKESIYLLKIIELIDKYEIPILFVYKRTKRMKEPYALPKKTIYETIQIPADLIEVKLKLKSLQNICIQLYTAKVKEQELESIRNRIRADLTLAKHIQQLVLPPPISETDIEIQGIFQPSSEISGDLFFWMHIDEGEYGLIMIDVSGKGVYAALISMAIRSLMPGLIKRVKDPFKITKELHEHMGRLFQKLDEETYKSTYFTAFIAYINTKERQFQYVNSGHPPAIIYCPHTENTHILATNSIPIGLNPHLDIEKHSFYYEPGSRFIVYTDGLIESPNHPNILRFDTLQKEFKEKIHQDTSTLLHEMLVSRMRHSEINDDICLIAGTLY
ncbi:PP2C family protein-serine/threonine phosphatase [Bacillus sp. JJ634]